MQDWPADRATLLVAVKIGRLIGRAVCQLALLVEVVVGSENVGPENPEDVAVKLVAAGLADEADDARTSTLVRSRRVLGFDAVLVNAVFGNLHCRDDCGCVVFCDSKRTAVEHVVNRTDDGAVDGVRRNIDAGTARRRY